mgnify:CR=1 FL=1
MNVMLRVRSLSQSGGRVGFAYIDPLHHLQVELIRRYRQGKRSQDRGPKTQTGIHLSINGIAAGLRNTG